MPQALILSPWTTDVEGGRYPLINDLLTGRANWSWFDLSAQASGRILSSGLPNMVAIFLTCDQNTLDAIDADARFRVVYDDGSRLASRVLNNNQFNQLKTFMVNKMGFTQAQVDAALGSSVSGRTVHQLVDAVVSWLRTA